MVILNTRLQSTAKASSESWSAGIGYSCGIMMQRPLRRSSVLNSSSNLNLCELGRGSVTGSGNGRNWTYGPVYGSRGWNFFRTRSDRSKRHRTWSSRKQRAKKEWKSPEVRRSICFGFQYKAHPMAVNVMLCYVHVAYVHIRHSNTFGNCFPTAHGPTAGLRLQGFLSQFYCSIK